MLFLRCLIISLNAPTICADGWAFVTRAREIATWTISICILGVFRTFLWSRCLITADSKKWVLCPARSLEPEILNSEGNELQKAGFTNILFKKVKKIEQKTRVFHYWLHIQKHRKDKPVIRRPKIAAIKVTEQSFKNSPHCCSLSRQLCHVKQADSWPEFRATTICSVYRKLSLRKTAN